MKDMNREITEKNDPRGKNIRKVDVTRCGLKNSNFKLF